MLLTSLLLVAIAVPPAPRPLQDDGFGMCPAFAHYHPSVEELLTADPLWSAVISDGQVAGVVLDGKCHDNDERVLDPARPKLPKPNPKHDWI